VSKWSQIQPIPGLTDPPWNRQKGESAKAYRAFSLYRDLDVLERSYEKASTLYGCRRLQFSEWAKKYRWAERIDQWDLHCERLAVAAQESAIVEMNQRHAGIAVEMLKKVLQRLVGDDVENVQAINASHLTANDCARLGEVAVKLERLARGSETERIGVDGAHAPIHIKLAFDAQPNFIGDNAGMRAGMIDYPPQRELPPSS
jgi:hypothetical protein